MKRHNRTVLTVLLVMFLMGATAQAQAVIQSAQDPRVQIQELALRLRQAQQDLQTFQAGGQRGGGGRGATPADPAVQQYALTVRNYVATLNGAWWSNTALVQQLGLTDDQKAKIEKAYENHRQTIASSTQLLDKEEAQLAKLLQGDPIDRNAVLTQIDHVVQARGEMERANSAMTLEMRESLTLAQWTQLQSAPQFRLVKTPFGDVNVISGGGGGGRGAAPLPSPSGPGQRRGPGQQ
jgi:Spy/CpxP family protein refolding chaperone